MLRSITVENYRSFADRATVHLRPITVLLGRNSAGKSSLTRLFPLLRQSMERGTSAPILWNSTSIDFGRISDVISRQNSNGPFNLTFSLTDVSLQDLTWRYRRGPTALDRQLAGSRTDLTFTASLRAAGDGKTDYERVHLQVDTDTIALVMGRGSDAQVFVNGRRVERGLYWDRILCSSKRLFPHIIFESSRDKERGPRETPATYDALTACLSHFIDVSAEEAKVGRMRNMALHGEFAGQSDLPFIPRSRLSAALQGMPGFRPGSLSNKRELDRLADLLLITHIGQLVDAVSSALSGPLQNLSYLGPIRASGNRFYREQELSVEKIDEKGENLATYIGSLSTSELASFNDLLTTSFGVAVRSHAVGGHISIEIGRPGDKIFDNLADVGFGFSQVLPLVAQIHSEGSHFRRYYPQGQETLRITAVEQPELHLHPAYQANLADLFVAAVATSRRLKREPIFLLETHSEALIGRLGELIDRGLIKAEDVAVHFVEKDELSGKSSIRLAEFDDEGFITNWPVGFFSARRY